jgi:hypothetical protein
VKAERNAVFARRQPAIFYFRTCFLPTLFISRDYEATAFGSLVVAYYLILCAFRASLHQTAHVKLIFGQCVLAKERRQLLRDLLTCMDGKDGTCFGFRSKGLLLSRPSETLGDMASRNSVAEHIPRLCGRAEDFINLVFSDSIFSSLYRRGGAGGVCCG